MSRGAKIALAIGCILIGVVQALAFTEWSTREIYITAGTWAVLLTVIAGLVFGHGWACFIIAGLVAFASSWYLYTSVTEDLPVAGSGKSEPSVAGAVACFVSFGLPAYGYMFMVLHRLSRRMRGLPGADAEVPPPIDIAPHDPLMEEAIRRAHATVERLRAYHASGAGDCYVKIALEGGDSGVEHVWAYIEQLRGTTVRVSLANEPVFAGGALNDEVTVPLSEINDWMVEMPDGAVRGGYSTIAMYRRARERGDALPPGVEENIRRFVDANEWPEPPDR
jgi:uncharacterized protein YegJ (DUF2314 family)